MEPVIKVEGLKKYFGDVSINGAGKSTTINMLCTLYAATAGSVEVCGYQVGKQDEEVRKRIGVVYQGNCLDDKLTVAENLFVRGVLYEKDHRKLRADIRRICGILELEDVYHRRLAKLSGGQKRRCEIARALVNAPEIMFLDEPTTGLDPATRKKVWASLERLRREEKITIFLTTHYMEEAARASHIAIMDAGHLKEYGTPFSLKEKYAKDQLRLYSRSPGLEERLAALQAAYRKKEDYFVVAVPESMAALAVLDSVRELIDGFEMVQGSMDDVFLNVTGKTLEG